MTLVTPFPAANAPLVDPSRLITPPWRTVLQALWNRTGGATSDTSSLEMPDFVAQYGGVGDQATNNDAAFTAAEASVYPVIWLPKGDYKTTFNRDAFFKKYRGPGKIWSNTGDQILVGFAATPSYPVGTPMPFGRSQTSLDGIPGSNYGLGGDTQLPDMRYYQIRGGRENTTNVYLQAGSFGEFSLTWNRSGGSGTTAMLAATASAGATTVTLNATDGITAGMQIGLCATDGATPSEVKTVQSVNAGANQVTFTTALANTYTVTTTDYSTGSPRLTHAMRTMNGKEMAVLHHAAGGDAYLFFCRVFVEYAPLAGQPTSFNTATGGIIGGDMNAKVDGIYMTGWECNYLDNGFDTTVVGTVNSYQRTNNTGARAAFWIGALEKNEGSKPLDGFYVMKGAALFGLDLVGADFSSRNQQAVNLAKGQRIVFNSTISNAPGSPARGWWGDTCGDVFVSATQTGGGVNRLTISAGGNSIAHFQANNTMQLFSAGGQLSVNGDIYTNGANQIATNQGGRLGVDGYNGVCYLSYDGTSIHLYKGGSVVATW